jgi:response regulator RpfG family c-di-GMP phosphodiesterase
VKKILFVDDDEKLLASIQRVLRNEFAIETAVTPSQGLTALEADEDFAVVVADMTMPQMSGVEFLSRVRRRAPDAVRIMFTGSVDQETAIEAVNGCGVFRFLTKPCGTELLVSSLREAVRQHDVLVSEREMMEKTVHGCVAMLTEILAVTDPKAYGQAQRLRDRSRQLAEFIGLHHLWELEVAALLSPIGYVTVPPALTLKARANLPLEPPEQLILRQVPFAGSGLVKNIPRLESVAATLLYQAKHFDGTGYPDDDVAGLRIPLHARILKITYDLLQLEQRGIHRNTALDHMRQRPGWYDPEILSVACRCFRVDIPQPKEAGKPLPVTLDRLAVGHLLLADVETRSGLLIVASGNTITETLLNRLQNFASMAGIKEPMFVDEASGPAPKEPEEPVTVTLPTFDSKADRTPQVSIATAPVWN